MEVAGPGLDGGQVAVLRLHAAVSWSRNDGSVLRALRTRITQMSEFLKSLRASISGLWSLRADLLLQRLAAPHRLHHLEDFITGLLGVPPVGEHREMIRSLDDAMGAVR